MKALMASAFAVALLSITPAYALTESTGLILVLLPGGRFWMGAQASDQKGHNHDPLAGKDEGPPAETEVMKYGRVAKVDPYLTLFERPDRDSQALRRLNFNDREGRAQSLLSEGQPLPLS